MFKKLFIGLLCFALIVMFGTVNVAAAEYPTRGITMIVPFGAGGGTDLIARQLADLLGEELGVTVTVENHPGAGSAIGINRIATAAADGYTIGLVAQPISALEPLEGVPITPGLVEAIAQINADDAAIIVSKDAPWEDVNELIEHARENPDDLSVGLTAVGATWWQAGQIFIKETGIEVAEITYPAGAAPIIRAVMAGEVDFGIVSAAEALTQVEDDELRYLALMSEEGSMTAEELFPGEPLLSDYNYDIVYGTWRGIVAPRGTSEEVIEILEEAIAKVVEGEEFVRYMQENRFGIVYRDSEGFTEFMASEMEALFELAEELELNEED